MILSDQIDIRLSGYRCCSSRCSGSRYDHILGHGHRRELAVGTHRIEQCPMGFERFAIGKDDASARTRRPFLSLGIPFAVFLDVDDFLFGECGKDGSEDGQGDIFSANEGGFG